MGSITHTFQSAIADDAEAQAAGEVLPSHWNAAHTIGNDTVTEAQLSVSDNTTKNVSTTAHGFVPKAPNNSAQFLNGVGAWAAVTASNVGLGNVTNDAQTQAAIMPNTAPAAGRIPVGNAGGTAYAPVAVSGDATLASTGALTIAAGAVTEAKQTLVDNTTNDVSTTKHGYAPKAPNDTTKFLRGDATWAVPVTPVLIQVACSDLTTALTTGTSKAYFRAPYAFTLTAVRAAVLTAPTGGTLLTVDINESGTTVLSTKLTFDASEKTTTTAATPAVISDSAIADDAEITIDIDAVGSTIAGAGLIVTLIGTKP